MKIKDMFKDDINRKINGVVKVEQSEEEIVEQEIKEYVVTTELKKVYTKFFNEYNESFTTPTYNTGVWITGFFGAGKSHFLKMLSYLLENKEINGKKTVDYFAEKFDDEASFMNVRTSTQVPTETILFNIDSEAFSKKDDASVIKVFAKMFYDHLGFYGDDLKLAKLEQFITKQGKMDAFKEAFEKNNGDSWLEGRSSYNFFEDDVVEALVKAEVMSETNAHHWFDGTETSDISINQLAREIKEYVDTKPKDFRLVFLVDEVGQYIGTNGNMLLHLQSILENCGTICKGQVWIIATGQEALDDLIKLRQDEFSRIMARFPIRLSLTSSSVDEVIEKRLLTKTDTAEKTLDKVYENNENVLKNLYAFDQGTMKDIKGYSSQDEFVRVFPFVPYQFKLMQKVFDEIRKHGHAGKHQSRGERSMLNGFQESAQRIENENEFKVVPFYEFYDTLHSFLDTSVRSVVERAERAADNNEGLLKQDTNLLKLLYLIRYIDDVPSNIENLTILMADSINVDKLTLRQEITESLERLVKENYVSRNGDIYEFLTDEEQDVAREISNINVDTAKVISKIAAVIFEDIYTDKKFKFKQTKTDYDFNKYVDGQLHGISSGNMQLEFITNASDQREDVHLITDSKTQGKAICKLSEDSSYFENIETILKIDGYTRTKTNSALPDSLQKIITNKQRERNRLDKEVKEQLEKAIVDGKFFIDGEIVPIKSSSAKATIDEILDSLVRNTYTKLDYITENMVDDSDIRNIATGAKNSTSNEEACDEVYNYLNGQLQRKLPTSMNDIQKRYQNVPFGWKEVDIAAVIAKLLYEQKVTIKYNGQLVSLTDTQLPNYLRKTNMIGLTKVAVREHPTTLKINQVRNLLKEYFGVMDVAEDEDGLVSFIRHKFGEQRVELEKMNEKNNTGNHPGANELENALNLVNEILSAQDDNIALVNKLCSLEEDLLDSKDDMIKVSSFYSNQINLYNDAVSLKRKVERIEKDYLLNIPEIETQVNKIEEITRIVPNYNYSRIPELNDCISKINDIRNDLISKKKSELNSLIDACISEIKTVIDNDSKKVSYLESANKQFDVIRKDIKDLDDLVSLSAKEQFIINKKDEIINKIEEPEILVPPTKPSKKVREVNRLVIFKATDLTSVEDIEIYLSKVKSTLVNYLQDDDVIKIK